MRDPDKHGGRRAKMGALKKEAERSFTVSGAKGNPDSKLFVTYALPGGDTLKVLDRRVLNGAYAAAGSSIQATLNKIKHGQPLGQGLKKPQGNK
ncbi:hypothetical protein MKK88_33670 [Methylobacterium sp. E-005]|uniref:hypothetical protein n=1 Tax=Methylobacterium sp. E-005 TaxID=2836549 RepID=UPI001FBAB60C|nr:hypothetical protein [Methylobacterium sp. E-005]MCJ2090896.1 hypothetical protein [Methylobacterium sp. E-005]